MATSPVEQRRSTLRTSRRSPLRASIILTLLAALLLSGCWSQNQSNALDHLNGTRRNAGKAALTGDAAVMRKAQAWSEHMARTGRLEHSGGGGSLDTSGIPCWRAVAENVGYGATLASVHAALVRSPGHYTNMIGPYTRVGTGVVRKGDLVWVTQIFYRPC